MTSKEQRKFKKKKLREKNSKKKVLAKREQLRAPIREERADIRRNKRHDKLVEDVNSLDNHFQMFTEEQLANLDEATLLQLEKNCKILRGLESEYEEEIEKKLELNASLEEEGHMTLQEKLNAVSQNNINQQKDQIGVVGGSADCKMGISPPKVNDTAEVSLLKSSDE